MESIPVEGLYVWPSTAYTVLLYVLLKDPYTEK